MGNQENILTFKGSFDHGDFTRKAEFNKVSPSFALNISTF
jgi:hypothetical protein